MWKNIQPSLVQIPSRLEVGMKYLADFLIRYKIQTIIFIVSFLAGIVLALFSLNINKERSKKHFRTNTRQGALKEIDKEIEAEVEKNEGRYISFPDDDLEQHSNKKFK